MERDGGKTDLADDEDDVEAESPQSSGDVKLPVLKTGVLFNATINLLEDGRIDVTHGGTLTSETFAILSDVFEIKKRHETNSVPVIEKHGEQKRTHNSTGISEDESDFG